MEALVVSLFDPSARDNGFALRVSSMIEALKPHSNVTVLTFSDSAKDGELVDGVGYNFVKGPRYTFRQRLIDTALLRSGLISRTYSPEFKSLFSRTLDQLRPDLIVYESVFMAQYAPSVTTARQWLDEHNIEWRVLEAFAHQDLRVGVKGLIPYIYHRLEAWKLKAIEKSIAGSMDRIFCVNADEANVIASVAKKS